METIIKQLKEREQELKQRVAQQRYLEKEFHTGDSLDYEDGRLDECREIIKILQRRV